MKNKVTIKDVAYIAGVSVSTVSRVVSGKMEVSEATLDKVKDAIKKTGYEPNYTARALATKSTDTIAVIIDRTPSQGFGNSFFLDALDGISNKLSEYKKDMILVFDNGKNYSEDEAVKRLINSNKIDSIIKLSIKQNDSTLNYLKTTNTPTVVVGRVDNDNILTVNNDNEAAMENATNHLIKDKNAKKIAFVSGSMKYIVSIDRKNGFINSLNKNGLSYSDNDFYNLDFSIESGYKIADELIEKNYDSVACTDDLIAYGICKRYYEKNKKINIVSFNNTKLAELSDIPISSVDINAKKLGEQSVELLFNESINNDIIVETKLIIRS